MMRRFLLHLKLEAWRIWPWLAIWGALLGLRALRFHVAWIDQRPERFLAVERPWFLDLPTLMMAVVPFLVMKLDDPGDPNAFWTTRPRTLAQLAVVKLGLIAIVVVGGWAALSLFEQRVSGFPQGWGEALLGDVLRVMLIAGCAAAAAWARTGWIAPAVFAAVVIGLWHSFSEGRTEAEAWALLVVLLLGAALVLYRVVRRRRVVGYAQIVVFLVIGIVAVNLLHSSGTLAAISEGGTNKGRVSASVMVEQMVEAPAGFERREPDSAILSFGNPLGDAPGIAVLVHNNDISLAVSGSIGGAGSDDSLVWEWGFRTLLRSMGNPKEPLKIRLFAIEECGVLDIDGGVVELPGSRTVIGAVGRSANGRSGRPAFSVSGKTVTLVDRRYRRFSSGGDVIVYRGGFAGRGYASDAELVEFDLLELRHRGTGETLQLSAEVEASYHQGRIEGILHVEWTASVEIADEQSGYDEGWLSACELVVKKSVPAGELSAPVPRKPFRSK